MNEKKQEAEFNKKGVEFLKYGYYEDALDMFLGSLELMTNRIRAEERESTHHNKNNMQHVIQAQRKQALEISKAQTIARIMRYTEDKPASEYFYSNALLLPEIANGIDTATSAQENNHQMKPTIDKDTVQSAIVLYNTALTHHLWNANHGSYVKAINLYEKVIKVFDAVDILTVENNKVVLLVAMATITNLIYLCNELQLKDKEHTYRGYLSDLVPLLSYGDESNTMNHQSDAQEDKSRREHIEDITKLAENAFWILTNHLFCLHAEAA